LRRVPKLVEIVIPTNYDFNKGLKIDVTVSRRVNEQQTKRAIKNELEKI